MKTAVIRIAAFVCLLGLVMSLPGSDQILDPECGIRAPRRSKRDINGTVADMTSSPWMDFLASNGTLITNKLVLTPGLVFYGRAEQHGLYPSGVATVRQVGPLG